MLNFKKNEMKKLTIYTIGFMFLFTSCKKYFEEVNTDPDNPLNIPVNVILGGVETTIAYTYGGDMSRLTSIYTQQLYGDSRQWAVLQNYGITGEDVNTLWKDNLYADGLMEIKQLRKKTSEDGFFYYEGIAQVLEAYILLMITDVWNDAPYSEAFQGQAQLQPAYDSQDQLYQEIYSLLGNARINLAKTDGGAIVPGGDDLLYSGDLNKWIGFSKFIEIRALLHRAKQNASNYQKALDIINAGGLTSDCIYPFSGGSFANPAFRFNEQRGDCSIGTKLKDLVTSLNDPRRHLYDQPFDSDNTFVTANKSTYLGTLMEQKFIEAECLFQTSGASTAHPVYLEAINLAFDLVGYTDSVSNYVAQVEVDPGASALTLEHIITQKYIAMFQDSEVFNDWRRTNFPTLVPNTGSEIPRRFPYPQSELNLNSNTPSVTKFNAVDWDV